MLINNPVITGSFTVNGTNFITNTPSTGSNTFNGNQIISGSAIVTGSLQVTGSVTTTGTITAQTLVVSTISSSIEYASGSNIFGSSLSNRQQMTGSLSVTGSLTTNGIAAFSSSVFINESVDILRFGNLLRWGFQRPAADNRYVSFVRNANATATPVWTIDGDNGNVGIGTTNPNSLFEVYAGTGSVFRAVFNGTNSMEIGNYKPSGTGAGYQELCIASSQINLLTGTAGGGSATSRIFVNQTGSVGIGTTNPSFILDVNDTNASGVRGIRISSSSATVGPGLFFYINSGAQTNWVIGNSYEVGNALEFRSSNSVGGNPGSAGTTRMLITSNGNVGIGSTSASTKLVVVGGTSNAGSSTSDYTLALQDPTSMAAGVGGSILFQGYKTGTSNIGNYAYVVGKKENGTAGNEAGYLAFGTFNSSGIASEKARITSYGAIQIDQVTYFICGTTGYRFNNSTDAFNNFIALDNGNATLRGTLTQNASDERLKNNIQIIPNAIDKISQLKGVTFEWNQELYETTRTTDIGVIAQDVQKVLPDAVAPAPFDTNFDDMTSKSGENYLTVYYEKLIPLLIEGMKEQQAQIEVLKTEIETLKNK